MSDTTTQMLPEALNRIQLGRVGRQADQLDLINMLSQPRLDRFGEVDAIIIHDHILFARWLFICHMSIRNQLREDRAKQRVVLMLAHRPVELPTHPVDQARPILFFVLARGLDFALVPSFAPTAHHSWQQGQIHFVFVVQINFASLGTSLQVLNSGTLLLILRVGTAHGEHGALHGVALAMQGMPHAAFTHLHPGLLCQDDREQTGSPARKLMAQAAWIALDQFQQLLQEFLRQLGRPPALGLRDDSLQSRLVECVDRVGHHIFAVEQQASNLRDAVVLDRQQDDMAVRFQHRIRRLMINPRHPLLFFVCQGAHIYFAWSAHSQSSLRGDLALYSMTFPAFVSTLYLVCLFSRELSRQRDTILLKVMPSLRCESVVYARHIRRNFLYT